MNLLDKHSVRALRACVGTCETTLIPRAQWYRLGREARDQLTEAGFRRSQARGLCSACYEYARDTGTIDQYERRLRPSAWLLEDFEHIRDTLPVGVSRAERLRRAGDRLNMSPEALDLALRRAGVAA